MGEARTTGFTEAELLDTVPSLRKFACRFHRSEHDIDDLIQETLAKALSSREKFQSGTRLRSWLFTIMRNTFCTKYSVSLRESVGTLDDIAGSGVVPAEQHWKMRGRELERAFSELPDNSRVALSLIFIEGISYEVAAERCSCPIGTVKSRVNRARRLLEDRLGPI